MIFVIESDEDIVDKRHLTICTQTAVNCLFIVSIFLINDWKNWKSQYHKGVMIHDVLSS